MHIVSKTRYAKQGDEWLAYPCALKIYQIFHSRIKAKTLSSKYVRQLPDNDKYTKGFSFECKKRPAISN